MTRETGVFISYAADTRELAEELTRALQREGIDAWADFKDLKPGQLWREEIEQALQRAQSLVILVTPHSQATRWSEAEWRAAVTSAWSDSGKMLLPVVVGGSEPPPFLRDWVSLRIDPADEPTQWTSRVLQALRSARNRVVQPSGVAGRRQRQQRLDEIEQAAKELREREVAHDQARPDSTRNIQRSFTQLSLRRFVAGSGPAVRWRVAPFRSRVLSRITRAIFNSRYPIHDLSRCKGER